MDSQLLSRVVEVTEQIAHSQDSLALTAALHTLNAHLRLNGSVFVSFVRDDRSQESYRFVNACPALWCQEYNANAWYMIDPCLLYALTHSEPTLVANIPVKTRGQQNMMDAARRFGFLTGLVIPAHSPAGRSRLGVLYLASGNPQHFDRSVQPLRPMLRALAGELLDWWSRRIRAELLTGDLSSADKELLQMTRDGYGSKEIAHLTGSTKNAIDQRMHRLASKLGAASRRQAADLADQYGLLS